MAIGTRFFISNAFSTQITTNSAVIEKSMPVKSNGSPCASSVPKIEPITQ